MAIKDAGIIPFRQIIFPVAVVNGFCSVESVKWKSLFGEVANVSGYADAGNQVFGVVKKAVYTTSFGKSAYFCVNGMAVFRVRRAITIKIKIDHAAVLESEIGIVSYGWQSAKIETRFYAVFFFLCMPNRGKCYCKEEK